MAEAIPVQPSADPPEVSSSRSMGQVEYQHLATRRKLLFSGAGLGSGMFNSFFNFVLTLFLEPYHLPNVVLGLVGQERSFLGSVFEPIVGTVSDRTRTRFGRRRPYFLIGAPLTALCVIVLGQQPPVAVLVPLLLVMPFFLVVAAVPYRAMIADIAAPQERGALGGIMTLMEMFGQIGLLLLAIAFYRENPTLVISLIAAVIVAGFGITFFSTKEPPLGPVPAHLPKIGNPLTYLRHIVSFREAAKLVAALTIFWWSTGGITPFLPRYAVYELGLTEETAFTLSLALLVATAACAIPAGYIGDRLGKKRVLTAGLLLFAFAAVIGFRASSIAELAVALVLAGVANGATTALAFPLLTELLPRQRMGELTGMGGMLWSMSQPLGSTFAGFVADLSGSLRTLFVLAAVYLVVSAVITATIRAPRQVQQT